MIPCLHIIDHLGLGGAQAVLLELVRNLSAEGFAPEVATLHGHGPFYEAIREAGIPVSSLSPKRWPPLYIPRLAHLASASRHPILHFHLQASNWIAKPLFALAGGQIHVAHDHASGDIRFRGWATLLPDAVAHGWSSHTIAVSRGVKDFLVRCEALNPAEVSVIPNGIDTNSFHPPTPAARAAARRLLGIADGTFVVGAMGRLSPEKNLSILPEVAKRLPGSLILIAGEGPCRPALEAQCLASGGAVRMLGAVSDRAGFYAALDAMVIPSHFEALPMVLLEAMACGLPVAASRLPDISAALDNGHSGSLCNPREADTFANALAAFMGNPAAAAQLGRSARTHCETEFSASVMAARVAALYRNLLETR